MSDTQVGGIIYATREEADDADRNWRLNEYEVTREYGGPEEGGWWYNLYRPTGQSIVLPPLVTYDEADDMLGVLNMYAAQDNKATNPHGIYSVLGGADTLWQLEHNAPEPSPATRPHYE